MATRGRPPKPIPLRVLEGNPGKRPLPKQHELDRRGGDPPEAPADLSADQRAVWQHVVDEVGVALRPADREVVLVFCVAADTFRKAAKLVEQAGVLVRGQRGTEVVRNPAASEARQWAKLVLAAGAELGMTPAARARLAGAPAGEEGDGAWLLG